MTAIVKIAAGGEGNTELTRFNAVKHGILSRYTVLPWEDADEYQNLLVDLVAEHQPLGPTEVHLVEELAGILWRKRRLRMAEAATHRRGLLETMAPYKETAKAAVVHIVEVTDSQGVPEAVRGTASDTQASGKDLDEDEAMTVRALDLLASDIDDAYSAALGALREDTRGWWSDIISCDPDDLETGEEPYAPDIDNLQRFLEGKVLPWYAARRDELSNRPLIREQAYGESLNTDKLNNLARYEVHLDRKLERMLAMLLKLQDLRQDEIKG